MICGEFLVKPSSWQVSKGRQGSEELDHKNNPPAVPWKLQHLANSTARPEASLKTPSLLMILGGDECCRPLNKRATWVHQANSLAKRMDETLKAFRDVLELLDN